MHTNSPSALSLSCLRGSLRCVAPTGWTWSSPATVAWTRLAATVTVVGVEGSRVTRESGVVRRATGSASRYVHSIHVYTFSFHVYTCIIGGVLIV